MQFSTKIDGFEQKDSQGFENSYNSYEQYPLEKFFIFTIYQNYTLALKLGGFAWIFISLFKSAAFSLQTSENNIKPPENFFMRQIDGQQWTITRGSYMYMYINLWLNPPPQKKKKKKKKRNFSKYW